MRYPLAIAALAIGLATPALAQSHILPAGSEYAAQPPIDWTAGSPPAWSVPRVYEGRSITVDPQATTPRIDRHGDLD